MLRIKIFALFVAFAFVGLVRPRKMIELLEAADAGAESKRKADLRAAIHARVLASGVDGPDVVGPIGRAEYGHESHCNLMWSATLGTSEDYCDCKAGQECPLPPAGWRCTRRAGHSGPCAAVEV